MGRAEARPSEEAMKIYFVAGEASGDAHGAALMRALREIVPQIHFLGRGGPRMQEIAGENFMNWSDAAAVVGLWEVVKHLGYFREQFRNALDEIATSKPDAVVLIDYPGFNLRLARALRKRSPHLKIIYYISPQVWAWNRGRITQMARFLDLMLCIFPFEAELYNKSGLSTIFVGHPMIESLAAKQIEQTRQPNLIGLFPGSRAREVRKIFPIMLAAAREIVLQKADAQFEVAAASEALGEEIRNRVAACALRDSIRIITGDPAGTMQRAAVAMVASGTATLEAAYFRLPFVLVYKVSWPTYFAARLLIKTKHIGMPNLLAGRRIIPEFVQHEAQPKAISAAVLNFLNDQRAREKVTAEFDAIIEKLGETGASAKAAEEIAKELAR